MISMTIKVCHFAVANFQQKSAFSSRVYRLIERRCGQIVESFGYNEQNGRLEETRKSCQRRPEKFTYAPNALHTGVSSKIVPLLIPFERISRKESFLPAIKTQQK